MFSVTCPHCGVTSPIKTAPTGHVVCPSCLAVLSEGQPAAPQPAAPTPQHVTVAAVSDPAGGCLTGLGMGAGLMVGMALAMFLMCAGCVWISNNSNPTPTSRPW